MGDAENLALSRNAGVNSTDAARPRLEKVESSNGSPPGSNLVGGGAPAGFWTAALDTLSNPCLDPLFWQAERLGAKSAWWEHVPFAHWIVSATAPRVLVELGTHTGVSYAAFCRAVVQTGLPTRCHAVDTWQGDPQAGLYGPEVLDEFRSFHDERFSTFSTLLQCTFDEALSYLENGSIDLLHLDGLHNYEAVRHDFESWLPKLSDRAVVLFHDINVRREDFGVWRLWAELRKQYSAFEFVHSFGLGVLAVGTDIPPAIAALCAIIDPVTVGGLRNRFARLGERWRIDTHERLRTQDYALHSAIANAEAERSGAELTRLQNECNGLRADVVRSQNECDGLRADLVRSQNECDRLCADVARLREETQSLRAEKVRFIGESEVAQKAAARFAEEAASFRASAGQAEIRNEQMQAECRETAHRAAELAQSLAEVEAELHGVRTSTAWLATWPLRAVGSRLPRQLRRTFRGGAKIVWWTTTFKLPSKLRERQQNYAPADHIPAVQFGQSGSDAEPQRSEPHCSASPHRAYRPFHQTLVQRATPRKEPVDIVICVHNALESVRACITSVLQCTMAPYRVVIIDDGSSPETASYLEQQAEEQGFTLLRNTEAKGYTSAANAGLRIVTAPWVVLLNSDTIVSPSWLDRMWAHGEQDPSIGIIGPVSNTASWQSVPRIFEGSDWAENRLPAGITVEEVGALVEQGTLGAIPMPFVNGFCLMIRSSLLKSVGVFDEATFGAGYGEENDLCIRVRNAGWRLVAATDAYVYHAQSKSYSMDRRLDLAKRADQLLLQKHDPGRNIWPQVAECRNSLAMASVRARLEGALLGRELCREGQAKYEGKRIAFILPVSSLGGGANVVLQEGAALQRMGVDVTLLGFEPLLHSVGPGAQRAALQIASFANPEAITRHLLHEQDLYDAVIATLYRGVYWLPVQADFRLGYYVQDFEPYFFQRHDPEYMTALQSYTYSGRLKLITKTLWNQKEVARHTRRSPIVIGPSVDTKTFAPGPNRETGDPIRIAAMVRPSTPRRAPARTLAVLDRVASQIGSSAELAIFGSTDDELKAAKLDSRGVRNVGPLDGSGMSALLANTDIFLDCSDYQAMGLTALEAMAAGCAVIAPERGGCNEFIRTGVNGFLVNSADEVAYADAVVRLASDESALTEMQLRAVADAGEHIPERAALRLLEAIFQ